MTSIGGFYVATSGNEQLASCAPNAGVFLHMPLKTVDDKPTNFKEMYATLLAAQLSGRVVSIELDPSNTAACTISYVTITDQ